MLRERYKFKLNRMEMTDLNRAIDTLFADFGQLKRMEVMLALTVLQNMRRRLVVHIAFPKKHNSIQLRDSEALAFIYLYTNRFFKENLTVSKMAGDIHRTI